MKNIRMLFPLLLALHSNAAQRQEATGISSFIKEWSEKKSYCCNYIRIDKCEMSLFIIGSLGASYLSAQNGYLGWYLGIPLSGAVTCMLIYEHYKDRLKTRTTECKIPYLQFKYALTNKITPQTRKKYNATAHAKYFETIDKEYKRLHMLQEGMENGLFARALLHRKGKYIPTDILNLIFDYASESCRKQQRELMVSISQEELYPILQECQKIGNYYYDMYIPDIDINP